MKERHNQNEVDFQKERRAQDGGLSYNERKTQPKMADFQLNEREEDYPRIGGLPERRKKTQPRWRTFK